MVDKTCLTYTIGYRFSPKFASILGYKLATQHQGQPNSQTCVLAKVSENDNQKSVDIIEITKLLASRLFEVTYMTSHEPNVEKSTKNVEVEMNFHEEVTGAAGKVEGNMIVNPKQNLADFAIEVQQLLQILDHSYPSHLPIETQAEIEFAVNQIEKNPTLKQRLISALESGSKEALKELMNNPYVNILVATYEGWRNP